jgi:LmbE family N-acetylglucosaminyl deacetylase
MKFDDSLEIERAAVIYAHPDDAEFGSSGTVAKWVRQGVEVVYVMVTNGGSGSSDPEMARPRLVEIRKAEQLAAAEVLGVKSVEFLGFEDGYLEPTLEVRKAVARQIRIHRPDVIFTADPTMRYREGYINHPDHVAVGEVVFRSINPDASTRLMFPELWEQERLEPHKPKALFLPRFMGMDAEHREDISETMELKVKALECHASQVGDWSVGDFIREVGKQVGQKAGVEYAEAFNIIRLGD